MLADIHILHESDVYRITDYNCHCDRCSLSDKEYNDSLSISFIRKGFFEYQTFRKNEEVHAGRILLSKPGYEHLIRHIEAQPDITTIFEFNDEFSKIIQAEYKEAGFFFSNNDIHSLLLQSNAELDYKYDRVLKAIYHKGVGLQIDEMVFEMIDKLMKLLIHPKKVPVISDSLKKFHLTTAEKARDHILENFSKNISLAELARHCLISPFHFSRIFKTIMNVSPHQYLLDVRLQHAKVLLSTTGHSISDIAFACNFSSAEHFSSAYRQCYKISPSAYRKQLL